MTGWRAGTVAVTGGHLAYHRTGGGGPTLVLSHGLTDNGLCWRRLAAALEAEFDVVMLDARGHGASSPLSARGLGDLGRDIAEAIDALGLIAPALMGHSVGALATAACAADHPGRAARIVLEDPPLLPADEPAEAEKRRRRFRRQVETLRGMSDAEITALGKGLSPDWSDEEFPAWTAAKRQVDPEAQPDFDTPWRTLIARIPVPTLLIRGEVERGGMVNAALADEAMALNPHVTCAQVRRAGHNIRRENFADTLSAVREFLLAA